MATSKHRKNHKQKLTRKKNVAKRAGKAKRRHKFGWLGPPKTLPVALAVKNSIPMQ